MTSLVWQCEWCSAWNAPDLDKCRTCLEKPSLKMLVSVDKPSVAKTRKTASKGQKQASKQKSKKIEYNGAIFDSKIEYERFLFLADCQRDGLITGLQTHPTYTLAPSVKLPASFLPKKSQGAITYTPDFVYKANGIWVYEDTKGAYGNSKKNQANGKAGKPIVTEAARLRHKLFIAKLASEGSAFHFQLVTVATKPIEGLERKVAA